MECSKSPNSKYDICLLHAEDLLESANILHKHGKFNIAYHLATLALEEIGASSLSIVLSVQKEEEKRIRRDSESHTKKLYWALITPVVSQIAFDKREVENYNQLADHIHKRRLKGIYVDLRSNSLQIPSNAISEEDSRHLISLIQARLIIAKSINIESISDDIVDNLNWFHDYYDNPEERSWISDDEIHKKFVELNNSLEWIMWIRKETIKRMKESEEIFKREFTRVPVKGDEDLPKWKIKIRLFISTHLITNKSFNWWNSLDNVLIKFANSGKIKSEFLVHFVVTKSVSLERMPYIAKIHAVNMILSLNIGAMGYVWWNKPRSEQVLFENIEDVELKKNLKLNINIFKIDGPLLKMDEKSLKDTALVFGYLGHIRGTEKWIPFDFYYIALDNIANDNEIIRHSVTACVTIIQAVIHFINIFDLVEKGGDAWEVLLAEIGKLFNDSEDYSLVITIVNNVRHQLLWKFVPTLEETLKIKMLFDYFALKTIREESKLMIENIREHKSNSVTE